MASKKPTKKTATVKELEAKIAALEGLIASLTKRISVLELDRPGPRIPYVPRPIRDAEPDRIYPRPLPWQYEPTYQPPTVPWRRRYEGPTCFGSCKMI